VNDEYGGPERRTYPPDRKWMDVWLTPTSLLVLLGGVTWGVQLNLAVGHLTEEVAEIQTVADATDNEVENLSDQILRTSLILERIESRLDKVEGHTSAGSH